MEQQFRIVNGIACPEPGYKDDKVKDRTRVNKGFLYLQQIK
jgi:hypothetical protein